MKNRDIFQSLSIFSKFIYCRLRMFMLSKTNSMTSTVPKQIRNDFRKDTFRKYRISDSTIPVMNVTSSAGRFSRNRIITCTLICLVIGYLIFLGYGYVIPANIILLNILGFVIFFAQALYNLAVIVMVNNTIEYDEYKYGERHDSIISAIRSFAVKLSNALNQAAASLILIVSGIYAVSQNISALEMEVGAGTIDRQTALAQADSFIATVQPSQTLTLRIGMVFVPLVMMTLAYLILRARYKIDEKEYDRIVAEIAKRQL